MKNKQIYIRDGLGNITEFKNYQEFITFASRTQEIPFSHNFVSQSRVAGTFSYTDIIKYIVLDTSWAPIHRDILYKDILEQKRINRKHWKEDYDRRRMYPHRPVFRRDPIPGIGKNTNTVRSRNRRPKTQAERKHWFTSLSEQREYRKYGVHIRLRLRRSIANIPEAWDDNSIADDHIRSWKRTKKKKQYLHPERRLH